MLSDILHESKDWLKKAPMPIIWLCVIALATWTYAIQSQADDAVAKIVLLESQQAAVAERLSRIETKVDRLLELTLELKARSRARTSNPAEEAK